ncbi:MAG TPA: helix-turn-helix transcriptional regulator [Pirellulales bacterium]
MTYIALLCIVTFMAISKDLVAASARPILLAILERGENYGYAVIQEVRRLSGGQLQWSDGMLYPVLHRLEKEELITATWKTSDEGRRRKYYKLNRQGTKALCAERAQWYAVHSTLAQLWGTDPCLT